MGRGTQLFEYLNRKEAPGRLEILHRYTGISITPELKKFRRKWQSEKKRREKEEQLKLWGD